MEDNALIAVGSLAAVLWVAVEGITQAFNRTMAAFGRAIELPKDIFALILGPLMGIVWFRQGYLPLGEMEAGWAYGMAALYGLLGMFIATLINDKAVKPLKKRLGKG